MKKMYSLACRTSYWVADRSGHPIAVAAFPLVCILWLWAGASVNFLTLVLSVLAITLTQMVLQAQKQETETNKLQMQVLLEAIPGVPNEVAYADRLSEQELRELKEKHVNKPKES